VRYLLPILLASAAIAQQRPPQPALPPLLECGAHGDVEAICGTRSPEDLEATPDGKSLIVSQMLRGPGAGLVMFDIAAKTFRKIPVTAEPLATWGDPKCPGPIGDALSPHGISLAKRSGGKWQLYVVNHGGRESIEMYELKAGVLLWHGCVTSMQPYNDVAALMDGGFVATHPTALQTPGMDLFTGVPSGYVVEWSAARGEVELPGTRKGYPNGVISDGRFAYYNAWTAKEVHKYDLKARKEVGMLKLDFMPDNLTWAKRGKMLAAGVKGTRGDCGGAPCMQGFGIAEIDGGKMTSKTVFDSQGKGALIGGVSVALQPGDSIYVGSFQGERILKIKR
jgi:hypothetical protein